MLVRQPGAAPARIGLLHRLGAEMRDAVRLFGTAAIPAHLPPFAGSEAYRAPSAARVAGILRRAQETDAARREPQRG